MGREHTRDGDAVDGHIGVAYLRSLDRVLAEAGLCLEDLPGGPALRRAAEGAVVVPVTAWREVLRAAAARLGRPALGLDLGRAFRMASLGPLGYVLQSSATLAAALVRLQHYERLVNDINRLDWRIEGDEAVLEWGAERGRPGALVDEAAIATLVEATRQILGRPDLALSAVDFVNPVPDDLGAYEAFFGCPLRFGQARTRVRFPAAILAAPLAQSDADLVELLASQVETLLARLPVEADVVQRVRRALARQLPEAGAGLESVAAALGLSPRTLNRRLEAAGSSFRALREDTRYRLAQDYLGDPRLTLVDIAGLLGFSEQSAFTRAFRRWAGVGPLAWRRQTRKLR